MSLARFGVRKPVPINLLMVAILLAGLVSGMSLRREFFPESDPPKIFVDIDAPSGTRLERSDELVKQVET